MENGVNEGSKKHTDTNERKRGDEAKLLNLSDLPFGYTRRVLVTCSKLVIELSSAIERKWVLSGSHIRLLRCGYWLGKCAVTMFRSSKVRLSKCRLVRIIASSG